MRTALALLALGLAIACGVGFLIRRAFHDLADAHEAVEDSAPEDRRG